MTFKPLDDRIVVRRAAAKEKSDGGVYLPDDAQIPADNGEVIAVGPGKRINGTDERATMQVKAGDQIYFGRYSGYRVLVGGEEFQVIPEDEVLGIMEEAKVAVAASK